MLNWPIWTFRNFKNQLPLMNFHLLLSELETHNLPKNDFAIGSSGVLAVRGIREANDLDIVVTNKLWNRLAKKNNILVSNSRPYIQLSGNIQILGNAFEKNFDLYTNDELVSKAEYINEIKYILLDLVVIMKQKIGREKDIRDIQLINEYLHKSK
jgi:hypothetical protein